MVAVKGSRGPGWRGEAGPREKANPHPGRESVTSGRLSQDKRKTSGGPGVRTARWKRPWGRCVQGGSGQVYRKELGGLPWWRSG